ncbi:protein-tyrosine phosphatase family protein [Luteolibacter soli]|uniref:Protein-tyrosine phosphatase family protein n=1 Tax=Luteolibacter soli TaxID=3135280 RepID=A0ABU9AYG1_9BACT
MKVCHYPVQPALFAGEYPGHDHDEDLTKTRLLELAARGVLNYIDLTSEEDRSLGLLPYDQHFADIHAATGSQPVRHSFSIPDMGIPADPSVMRGILDLLHQETNAGRTCYVHCWGGIGRTGTVVACWLKERGMDSDAALAEVQRLYSAHMDPEKQARYPRSPQQEVQLSYVRDWH